MIKWLKRLALIGTVVFATYLYQLNILVNDEFSKSLSAQNSDLPYQQHPKALVNMLLVTEDQLFFKHYGVDFGEIAVVLRDYYLYDKPIRGASTITQQLIKNTLLTREKTVDRKVKEALMALLLEMSFDKEMILNRYMNSVYLGQYGRREVRGFQRASQFYFDKNLADLSHEGLATLVALLKGPSYYHPVRHSERLIKRRNLVLHLYHKYQKVIK